MSAYMRGGQPTYDLYKMPRSKDISLRVLAKATGHSPSTLRPLFDHNNPNHIASAYITDSRRYVVQVDEAIKWWKRRGQR